MMVPLHYINNDSIYPAMTLNKNDVSGKKPGFFSNAELPTSVEICKS